MEPDQTTARINAAIDQAAEALVVVLEIEPEQAYELVRRIIEDQQRKKLGLIPSGMRRLRQQ